MSTKILVALRPGYSHTPAIDRAQALAKKFATDILLYSGVYDEQYAALRYGYSATMEPIREAMLQAEHERLEEVKKHFTSAAKSVSTRTLWGHPAAEGIVQAAEDFEADLIIVSSVQHSAVSRLALSNTDWGVLRTSPVPVLFAHQRAFRPYQKVVVAVDPIHEQDELAVLDDKLIRSGQWLCEAFGGELHLAHAYPSMASFVTTEYLPPPELIDQWQLEHEAAVNDLAAKHKIQLSRVHLLDNAPKYAIPSAAKEMDADLVVIGSVSRSFLKRLIVGRTTEYLLDHLECDVMTVRGTG